MRRLIVVVLLVVALVIAMATAAFAPKRYVVPSHGQSITSLVR